MDVGGELVGRELRGNLECYLWFGDCVIDVHMLIFIYIISRHGRIGMSIDALQMILNQMGTAIELYPTNSLWVKAIPAVISVFNELIMFCDASEVEKRLSDLETKVEELEIGHEEFVYSVNELSYHDKYAFRNFLKSYCLETLPEVTDAMIYALIDFAMDKKSGIREEVCEILKQFNAIDIECMRRIKAIANDEEITKKREKEVIKRIENQQNQEFKDNIFYSPGKSVFWDDFAEYRGKILDEEGVSKEWIPNVSNLMAGSYVNENKEKVILSQLPRSLIKLQNLGVLMIFNKFILGDLPMYNIHIFSMTDYGMKILEYIK